MTLASGLGTDEESPLLGQAESQGVRLRRIPHLVRSVHPLKDLSALWACYRMIREGNFDLVHTHTSKAGIVGRLAARFAGGCRVVHTPHGHIFYGYFGPLLTRLFIWGERLMAGFTNTIVTLTDREAEEHLAVGVGRAGQFLTIFSGIPLPPATPALSEADRAEKCKSLGLPAEGELIASVGRLEPVKGHGDLIRAFSEVRAHRPRARLVLVGDGAERARYESLAGELGLREEVLFLGWREDVADLLPVADLFVLPSVNEGMGRVVVQAMAAGLAVVATRVGGVPQIVEEGRTGLLVPARDPRALAEAVRWLLDHPEERRAMGEAGRERAGRFSVESMCDLLEGLYRRLLHAPPPEEAAA